MKASETKLQPIIEGTKQYVVPLFQRPYSWEKSHWDTLWGDLEILVEDPSRKDHFLGSIVTMPTVSVPEGVAKYLLIDGQQRLTTIFILLALIRDKARLAGEEDLAQEINDTLLINKFKKEQDYFKFLPTQLDRDRFNSLITESSLGDHDHISKAYSYFERRLRTSKIALIDLKRAIIEKLTIVSIVLDADDNPHLVFESLNATGKPLTQGDLIRNYFFMRIHVNDQEATYAKHWRPMQEKLGESLTEFVRHYLMREGTVINKSDVYLTIKDKVTPSTAVEYLKTLNEYAGYYQLLLQPSLIENTRIANALGRLLRLEVGTSFPFLLNCLHDFKTEELSENELVEIIAVLENFMVRRFVCSVPTYGLANIFPAVYRQAKNLAKGSLLDGVKKSLQDKGYPKDNEFFQRLQDTKLYGPGSRVNKARVILEGLEASFNHKEPAILDQLTIEHVMPQTLSDQWCAELGEDWSETHELYLHTLGNLTLTAYNSELSNDLYSVKRELLIESHLELNGYFESIQTWNRSQIELRAKTLAELALSTWSYFGDSNIDARLSIDVTGKSPIALTILGERFEVSNWREVLENAMNTIAGLEPEKFGTIVTSFPKQVSYNKKNLRDPRQLSNGAYIEVNRSAKDIERFCRLAFEAIDLTLEDWSFELQT
ncbi:MAG TPA: DUF262 domain-containing protein [Candidatus Kapabacteria bacterium]|nr:DUF262 domain-containing protein [Candidatus Kapabacteria bacterium]